MTYGAYVQADSGRYIISTAARSYCFVGKAVRSSISFSTDQPGVGRRHYYYLSSGDLRSTVTSISAPAGTAKLEVAGSCGSLLAYSWPIPDESALAVYTITSVEKPLVFVSSTGTASGAVASIVSSGANTWNITVTVGYSSRSAANSVELYCFAPISDAPNGYGFALYGADGSVTYHSGKKLLQPAGVLTINGASTNGSAISVDYDISTGVSSASKPCVLATDWLRATRTTKAGDLSRALISSTFSGCYYSGCNLEKVVSQNVVSLGFAISGSVVTPKAAALSNGVPVAQCNGSQALGTSVYSGVRTVQMPASFPVIDGADYD